MKNTTESKFKTEFKEYWDEISKDMVFEDDLHREWFYIQSMNNFMTERTNIKRIKTINKMLNNDN